MHGDANVNEKIVNFFEFPFGPRSTVNIKYSPTSVEMKVRRISVGSKPKRALWALRRLLDHKCSLLDNEPADKLATSIFH